MTGGTVAVEVQERAERFARDMAAMRVDDPSKGRQALWLRLGVVLMVGGLVAAVIGVARSSGTTDPLIQRDALVLATAGVAGSIVGAAVYLRYAVTKVLRFWMARLSFELDERNRGQA